jgi:choline-sulfatase
LSSDKPPRRPNILFLMTDQHRADFVGYEGHMVRTPTLDWLARTGAQFRNAYTPSPVCVPARQAMMSGQLPRTCDCLGWIDLKPDYMTFAKRFSQYAYQTTCCGKLHHSGPDQMQGWRWRIGEETHISPQEVDGRVEVEFARYHPTRVNPYGPLPSAQGGGSGQNPVELVDAFTTQGALNYIKLFFDHPMGKIEDQPPLLLKVSLIAPHDPFITKSESYDYYYERVEPFPIEDPLSELGGWPEPFGEDRVSVEQRRRAVAGYCGMIEECDKQFAQVLDALRDAGQDLDDWIIVYASDHGEMLGQYNLWWKFRFTEGSVRVPLLIRAPRFFEGACVVPQNVNLCDLFATLCDFADIPAPDGLDSRSLRRLCSGDAADWENESISHYGKGDVMIKRDDLKYIYMAEDATEILFDCAVGDERMNFAADGDYAEAMAAFRARRSELGYGPEADAGYINAGYAR